MEIASWNVNSIKARLDHVKNWLDERSPDVLLLQELKGLEFPFETFRGLGYESIAITQKAYNGVAVLSRVPIKTVSKSLAGMEVDTHARFLEVMVKDVRIVNIYLPNGNPMGTEKFEYKLDWMDRLLTQMKRWLTSDIPTVVGGDFNVIPDDIDCHKPASWIGDTLFQPESRARYKRLLDLGYIDACRSLHPDEKGQSRFGITFVRRLSTIAFIGIDHFLLSPDLEGRLKSCEIDKAPRALLKPSDHTPIVLTLN